LIEPILALLFGFLIGSFLNVCIHRWPRGRSVVRPRSHCVRCRKLIAWYDNIPVLSYIVLRGKCRHCSRRISMRYPLVELLTGTLFFVFVRSLGPTLAAGKMCVFASLLVALIFSDLEKLILPDQLTLGGAAIGLVLAPFVPIRDDTAAALFWIFEVHPEGRWLWLADALVGAAIPALFLWLGGWIYEKVRHREGLGFGDVKLMIMVGSFLGLQLTLFTLLAGSVLGSVVSLAYIAITRKDAATYQLPFGTFLGAAALLIALAGPKLFVYGGL
jgi:leader peptidase (prepilin peptidase)/N-methyltransferase